MYSKYFGFTEIPFSIAPDPRYLYMSEQHREALAHLLYGFNSDGGFVLLTGEVGTGKTTVCRCLLQKIPQDSAIAFILNPKLTVEELLATICDEFGIDYPAGNTSIKVFIDRINSFLLKAHSDGKKAALIIDEAQNLSADVLEQLRLLTNLETNQQKLLHIILIGQPELKDQLSEPQLRQLSQRIIARYHLGPLSRDDVSSYIAHRLSVAGIKKELFPDSCIDRIYELSGGLPRLINLLCDRALLGAFVRGKERVSSSILTAAAGEVLGKQKTPAKQRTAVIWALPVLILALGALVMSATFSRYSPHDEAGEDTSGIVTEIPQSTDTRTTDALVWSEDLPVEQSRDISLQSLLSLWGYASDESLPVCKRAEQEGLHCHSARGNLGVLRRLNRPVVMKLVDDTGGVFHATLTSLDEGSGTFIVGDRTVHVPTEEIHRRWLGYYTVLWKVPPGYRGYVKQDDSGPAVVWLDKQLSIIMGEEDSMSGKSEFDHELFNRVKRFQRSVGLIPDGIAGVQTLVRINMATGADSPALTRKKES
jgi:general secretion pathway protein A